MLVGLCSCDLDEPGPVRIESIEIAAAETLTVYDRSTVIRAVLRDAQGRLIPADQLRGRTVTWTSAHEELRVNAMGGDSARATWDNELSLSPTWYDITDVEVTATVDAVTATGGVVICPALQVAAHNTAIAVAGRSFPLIASVLGSSGGGLSNLNVLMTRARWTSSNPAVVSVSGDVGAAVATGTATLVSAACGMADTVEVAVIPTGYTLIYLGDGTRAIAINDSGSVLGSSAAGAATPLRWVWRGGSFTAVENCTAVALNDASTVLCNGPGPRTWKNGVVSVLDTLPFSATALNDSGRILMVKAAFPYRIYLWRAPGRADSLSSMFTGASFLNNRGDVAGTNSSALYPYTIIRQADGTHRGVSSYGRSSGPGAMNDSADAVGWGEGMTPIGRSSTATIWFRDGTSALPRKPRGPATNIIARNSTGINNARTVVGNGNFGAWVLLDGRVGLLTNLVEEPNWQITAAMGINNSGVIIAEGYNTRTLKTGAVVLTPSP